MVSSMLIKEVVDGKDQALDMVGKMLIKEVDDKTEDDKTEALARIGGMVEVEDKKAVSKMLTSDEDTFESLQEVAKSEDVIFDANKSPETKSESRWWKKRRSIDVFEDVEMPLKKIKTEKSEIDSETKSPGGEAKKRQWSKCGECKGWFSKKY